MADFYALTTVPLPKRLHSHDQRSSVRPLSSRERLGIEDRLFASGFKVELKQETTAVVVSQSLVSSKNVEEFATLSEFALGILAAAGHQLIDMAAHFTGKSCVQVARWPSPLGIPAQPTYAKALNGVATSTWLRQLFAANGNTSDRMHITADRFVRYLRAEDTGDSLVDLCISLESLLESQTEVEFRFGTCLARFAGQRGKEALETAELLEDLYDLRSKIVHGDPAATKLQRKIGPHLPALRRVGRTILTKYVLFMSEHSRSEWKQHLKLILFE